MLTASIVTFHTPSPELKQSLDLLNNPVVEKVWIIDNGCDKYIEDICTSRKNVVYIPSENRGYGAGHNIALRKAAECGSRFHLIMNSDIRFDNTTLSTMVDYMTRNCDVASAQPRIINPDGSMQYTVRMLPTPFDLIIRRFLPESFMRKRRDRYLLKHIDHDKEFNVPYHQGSFMILRTDLANNIGGFDERFFMYPEDIDLTRRLHKNYRTMYTPVATVIHDHRAESYKSFRMTMIHITNMIRYFNKWGWWYDPERKRINKNLK